MKSFYGLQCNFCFLLIPDYPPPPHHIQHSFVVAVCRRRVILSSLAVSCHVTRELFVINHFNQGIFLSVLVPCDRFLVGLGTEYVVGGLYGV